MMTLTNRDAEEKLVGTLLMDNSAYDDIADVVSAADFSARELRDAFVAFEGLRKQRAEADAAIVARALGGDSALEGWLLDLQERAISAATARAQALQIANLARQRRLYELLAKEQRRVTEAVLLTEADALTYFADVQARVVEATSVTRTNLVDARAVARRVMKFAEERVKNRGKLVGFTTGFEGLDRMLLGIRRKALYVIAAKTGVGKTAIGLNMARSAASTGARGAVFSLEMGIDELGVRSIANASNVSGFRIEAGELVEHDFAKLARGVNDFANLPLLFTDEPPTSIRALRATCQSIKRRLGLDFVLLDYLQLLDGDSQNGTREREVASVSRGLKRMAFELDIAVIALSQLNRGKDHNEEPSLGDLRDSGAIEQDANAVMFIWGDADNADRAHLKLAKNRGGPPGQLLLGFNKPIQRFTEMPS